MDGHSSHYSPEMIRIAADPYSRCDSFCSATQHNESHTATACFWHWNPTEASLSWVYYTKPRASHQPLWLFNTLPQGMGSVNDNHQYQGITPFNSRAITLPGEDKFERFTTFHYTPVVQFVRGQVTKMPMREITVRYISQSATLWFGRWKRFWWQFCRGKSMCKCTNMLTLPQEPCNKAWCKGEGKGDGYRKEAIKESTVKSKEKARKGKAVNSRASANEWRTKGWCLQW